MKINDYIIAFAWGIVGTVIIIIGILIGHWIYSGFRFSYTLEIREEMTVYAKISPLIIAAFGATAYFGRKKNRRPGDRD